MFFVASEGSHDCRMTTSCTTETHRYQSVRIHWRLWPTFLFAKPGPSEANKVTSVMAPKEAYDSRILTGYNACFPTSPLSNFARDDHL